MRKRMTAPATDACHGGLQRTTVKKRCRAVLGVIPRGQTVGHRQQSGVSVTASRQQRSLTVGPPLTIGG